MADRITVGFDGSCESAQAVLWAADEAMARCARLRVVTCFRTPRESESDVLKSRAERLERIRAAVCETHPRLDVKIELLPGSASAVLVGQPCDDDMLVLGASSHHGAAAFWLGCTPRSVVRHARCPVVVVRGAPSGGRPCRVLVGVDGSGPAEVAMRWAAVEADL